MTENKETRYVCEDCPTVRFVKADPRAIIPTKGNPLAMGYDLTPIDVWKSKGEKVIFFDTGIIVEPPHGYYTEIFPRSSLSKSGYILANSVGVIDPDFRGSLKLALIRIDDSLPEIDLKTKKPLCQLILRKCEYFKMEEVESLSETERGDGGFGSTDSTGMTHDDMEAMFSAK